MPRVKSCPWCTQIVRSTTDGDSSADAADAATARAELQDLKARLKTAKDTNWSMTLALARVLKVLEQMEGVVGVACSGGEGAAGNTEEAFRDRCVAACTDIRALTGRALAVVKAAKRDESVDVGELVRTESAASTVMLPPESVACSSPRGGRRGRQGSRGGGGWPVLQARMRDGTSRRHHAGGGGGYSAARSPPHRSETLSRRVLAAMSTSQSSLTSSVHGGGGAAGGENRSRSPPQRAGNKTSPPRPSSGRAKRGGHRQQQQQQHTGGGGVGVVSSADTQSLPASPPPVPWLRVDSGSSAADARFAARSPPPPAGGGFSSTTPPAAAQHAARVPPLPRDVLHEQLLLQQQRYPRFFSSGSPKKGAGGEAAGQQQNQIVTGADGVRLCKTCGQRVENGPAGDGDAAKDNDGDGEADDPDGAGAVGGFEPHPVDLFEFQTAPTEGEPDSYSDAGEFADFMYEIGEPLVYKPLFGDTTLACIVIEITAISITLRFLNHHQQLETKSILKTDAAQVLSKPPEEKLNPTGQDETFAYYTTSKRERAALMNPAVAAPAAPATKGPVGAMESAAETGTADAAADHDADGDDGGVGGGSDGDADADDVAREAAAEPAGRRSPCPEWIETLRAHERYLRNIRPHGGGAGAGGGGIAAAGILTAVGDIAITPRGTAGHTPLPASPPPPLSANPSLTQPMRGRESSFARLKGIVEAKGFAEQHGLPAGYLLPGLHDLDELDRKKVLKLEGCVKSGLVRQAQRVVRRDNPIVEVTFEKGRTLLHLAACGDNFATAEGLPVLAKLATPLTLYHKDEDGNTPLFLAVKRARFAIVNVLVSYLKVTVDDRDEQGRTPLMVAASSYAFEKRGQPGFACLEKLMTQATVNMKSPEGMTALHLAIDAELPELASWMTRVPNAKIRADPRILDPLGRTAEDVILQTKRDRLLDWAALLIEWGVDEKRVRKFVGAATYEEAQRRLDYFNRMGAGGGYAHHRLR